MHELTIYQPQVYTMVESGTTDEQLLELWLHGRPVTTQEAYSIDIRAFFHFLQGKTLQAVMLADLQHFSDSLSNYEDATKARRLKAVKSLLSFAAKTHYIPFNVGAAMKLPKVRKRLHERILSEEQVLRIFVSEHNPRNYLLLRLLYFSGMRVSELCALCWRDLYPGPSGTGVVAVYGKGSKERSIPVKQAFYEELLHFRAKAAANTPIFVSRGGGTGGKKSGGHLDKTQVERIVQSAAEKARIGKKVTPHFFRHSHATHAVLNGAPAPVIKITLGHESLETTMQYFDINPNTGSSLYLKL